MNLRQYIIKFGNFYTAYVKKCGLLEKWLVMLECYVTYFSPILQYQDSYGNLQMQKNLPISHIWEVPCHICSYMQSRASISLLCTNLCPVLWDYLICECTVWF
jgi:hypothetical protein